MTRGNASRSTHRTEAATLPRWRTSSRPCLEAGEPGGKAGSRRGVGRAGGRGPLSHSASQQSHGVLVGGGPPIGRGSRGWQRWHSARGACGEFSGGAPARTTDRDGCPASCDTGPGGQQRVGGKRGWAQDPSRWCHWNPGPEGKAGPDTQLACRQSWQKACARSGAGLRGTSGAQGLGANLGPLRAAGSCVPHVCLGLLGVGARGPEGRAFRPLGARSRTRRRREPGLFGSQQPGRGRPSAASSPWTGYISSSWPTSATPSGSPRNSAGGKVDRNGRKARRGAVQRPACRRRPGAGARPRSHQARWRPSSRAECGQRGRRRASCCRPRQQVPPSPSRQGQAGRSARKAGAARAPRPRQLRRGRRWAGHAGRRRASRTRRMALRWLRWLSGVRRRTPWGGRPGRSVAGGEYGRRGGAWQATAGWRGMRPHRDRGRPDKEGAEGGGAEPLHRGKDEAVGQAGVRAAAALLTAAAGARAARRRPSGAGPGKGRRSVRRAGGGHGIPAANRVGRRRRGPRGRGAFRIRSRGRRGQPGRPAGATRRRRVAAGSLLTGSGGTRPFSSLSTGAAARLVAAVLAALGNEAARWIGKATSGAAGRSPRTPSPSGARGRRARASRTRGSAHPGESARAEERVGPAAGGGPRRSPARRGAAQPGTAARGVSVPMAPTTEGRPGGRSSGGAQGAGTAAACVFEARLGGPRRAGPEVGRAAQSRGQPASGATAVGSAPPWEGAAWERATASFGGGLAAPREAAMAASPCAVAEKSECGRAGRG